MRYAEIDISLYDNPRLKSYKGLADEAAGRSEGEGSGEESGGGRKERKKHKAKRKLPHEKLLLFVGQEWKDLIVEVRTQGLKVVLMGGAWGGGGGGGERN